MTSYHIRIRNPETKRWDSQQTIKPLYKYATIRVFKYWFFRTSVGIIPNMLKAEKLAKKLAIRTAKKMYGHLPCSIERVSMWNAIEVKDVIWSNRKAKNTAVSK